MACLESVYAHSPHRTFLVTVADNASSDGSREAVQAQFSQARIIETGGNIGYGRANNRALLGVEGVYYAILNSDLVLQAGSLDKCCDYLDCHSEVGIVGGALLNPDGSPQMNWAAGELSNAAIASEQYFLAQALPRSRRFGDYFRGDWTRGDTRALPQVCGAFLVVRAALFNDLGGFDPAYFMYCEDTDLCKRIRLAGSACVYLHDATAIHGHGKSSVGKLRARMVLEHNLSRLRYITTYYGEKAARKARRIMLRGAWLRIIIWTVLGRMRGRRDWLDKARVYEEVLSGTIAASENSSL